MGLLADTWKVWEFANDVMTVLKPDCAGFASFEQDIIVRAIGPMILGIITLMTWGGSVAVQRFYKNGAEMDKDRMINVFGGLIFTFYAGIAANAFMLFKCVA